MLINDQEILTHIRTQYPGFQSYNLNDGLLTEENSFITINDIHKVDETNINIDKDIFVRNLVPNRQTNCANLRLFCDSLNADGSGLGDEVYKELESYNRTYTRAYLKNGSHWVDLKAFFVACDKVKEQIGNPNPRALFDVCKYVGLDKGLFDSANVKLNLVNMRALYELFYIETRKSNYDLLIQPVTTSRAVNDNNLTEYSTLLVSKYFSNFELHRDIRFDHEHQVFGVIAGLAARKQRPFAQITPYYYCFDLYKLLQNEYSYLQFDVEITNTPDKVMLVNNKPVAHQVLLKKTRVESHLSPYTKRSASIISGSKKSFPTYREIYDHTAPCELTSMSQGEINDLVKSGAGMIVYHVDETVYDNFQSQFDFDGYANVVVRKGEMYNAKYNLFNVLYTKRPKIKNLVDYGYFYHTGEVGESIMLPASKSNKNIRHIQMIKLFESMLNEKKQANAKAEQAQKALLELEERNRTIQKMSEDLRNERDLLEQKVKERTRELEQANDQQTNTFINLTHEIRTPITLINNYLDEYILNYGMNKELEVVRSNIEKLNYDINNIFITERLKRGLEVFEHTDVIDFSETLKNALILFRQYAAKKNIIITQKIEDKITIKTDKVAIGMLINNLIDNAIKYTPDEGLVKVNLHISDNTVLFIVEDSGYGIPKDKQELIFNPFVQVAEVKQSSRQGLGMGLSIVHAIVKGLNGEIKLESEHNKGTRFIIELKAEEVQEAAPVEDFELTIPQQTKVDKEELKDVINGSRHTVMLVEDELNLLAYMHYKLQEKYNVYIACDGQEALEKLQNYDKLPDLLISDVMMDHLDGFGLLKTLSNNSKYDFIPVILLTAKTTLEDKLIGLDLGAIDFIHKPFYSKELLKKIESVLVTMENQRSAFMKKVTKINGDNGHAIVEENVEFDVYKSRCIDYNITRREREIIELVTQDFTHQNIANELKISFRTVGKHIQNIYDKTGVSNKEELVQKLFC